MTATARASIAPLSGDGRHLLVSGNDLVVGKPLPAGGTLVLGRDVTCDVALPDRSISRRHARLILDGRVTIEDLGSRNGVWVAGARLSPGCPAELSPGESARLGPYTVVVVGGPHAVAGSDVLRRNSLAVADPTLAGRTELVERIARHEVNVLVQGETGSGKEVLARTLHTLSGRPGELLAINCAALSGPLLESELFGHERGAFTGASRTKPGLLEVAGGGTVLLDEIGDLPLELQGKLLRAIESRRFYRVGGVEPVELRARLIAATHRNLPDEVASGGFRQDLYFRLNGITLEVQPLRERRASIMVLADRFLDDARRGAGVAPRFAPAALAALASHDWPGNVRELRLVVERALLLAGGGTIEAAHILLTPARSRDPSGSEGTLRSRRDRFIAVARASGGNISAMGRALATSRSHVRRLAQKFDVDLDALRRDG